MMKHNAFTLAELLIALVILGVIATFTIPKVLSSQQASSYNAAAKETAGMISGAYSAYKQAYGIPPSTMWAQDLSPYMNYLSLDSGSSVDDVQTQNVQGCTNPAAHAVCLNLHSGAKLRFWNSQFGGTQNTSAVLFWFDPDGKVTDGTTNGPGKSVAFVLYYNGLLTSYGRTLPNSCTTSGCPFAPNPNTDPPWFSWN